MDFDYADYDDFGDNNDIGNEEQTNTSEVITPAEAKMVAKVTVKKVLGQAERLLKVDPYGYFLYTDPRIPVISENTFSSLRAIPPTDILSSSSTEELSVGEELGEDEETEKDEKDTSRTSGSAGINDFDAENVLPDPKQQELIEWLSISQFTFNEAAGQIRDFICLWKLHPTTKFTIISENEQEDLRPLGKRYFLSAIFSKPTPSCPNPLSVAIVFFHINVSSLVPKHYPIMVTYRFEGYKTVFFATGPKCVRSMTFQRFFIDSIIQMKLKFYSEVYECLLIPPESDQETNANSEPEFKSDTLFN